MAQKYYAVHNGREGTQIYLTWEETKANVSRVPRVIYKSFRSPEEAQAWLQGIADATDVDAPPPYHEHGQQVVRPVQSAPPPPLHGQPGPSRMAGTSNEARHAPLSTRYEDAMEIDSDSDIEILPGPPATRTPSTRSTPSSRSTPQRIVEVPDDDDSDIEILEGPPPVMQTPRANSRRPQPPRAHTQPAATPRAASRQPLVAAQTPRQERRSGSAVPYPPRAPSAPPAPQSSRGTKNNNSMNSVMEHEEGAPQTAPPGLDAIAPEPEIQLSPEQLIVLAKVKNNESVFFTGSAGTGKSVLLREIIKYCGGKASMRLGVTASTGIASVNIGGCTLHSWAGIGLGKEDADSLVGKILGMSAKAYKAEVQKRKDIWAKKRRGEKLTYEEEQLLTKDPADTCKSQVLNRWRQCRTLIIDEISMIDGKLFDKLEYCARKLRKNQMPFGGIQLVLSGDFCQLPPVPDKSPTGGQIPATFAFDAESWNRCVGAPIVLKKVFRQKEQKFVDMLNAMRFGNMDERSTVEFRRLSREVKYDDGIEPTELYPTRAEVESANSRRLKMLQGNPKNYKGLDAPGRDDDGKEFPPDRVERALKDVIVPKVLPLKVGAQVMLLKNIIQGVLVNGSLGRVIGFYKPREAMAMGIQICLPESREQSSMRQAMGNAADANAKNGQEIKSEDLALLTEADKAQAEQREQRLKQILALNSVWPAVQFASGPTMLCVPLTFEVINANATIEAVREQVPLMLAWALSIHKSQGQTLERVRVDLNRIFEKGQAYVALSRATRMEALQVLNFDPVKVQAHKRVLQWMAEHDPNQIPALPYIVDEVEEVVDVDEELEYWKDIVH